MTIAMFAGDRPVVAQELAQALRDRGHRVTVFLPGRPGREDDPHTVRYRLPGPARYPFSGAGGEIPNLNGFDLIHIHRPDIAGRAGLCPDAHRGVPVALSDDGAPRPGGGITARRRRAANRCDLVFAPTPAAKDLLKAGGVSTPVEVLSNWLPSQLFRPDIAASLRMRARWLAGRGRLFCCAPEREEDARFLLRAAAQFKRRRGDDFRLLFLGAQPSREKLEGYAQCLGVGADICFAGRDSDEECGSKYRAGDLFLSAGPLAADGFTALEAMAAGLPVLAPDTGAAAQFVEEGRNGWTAGGDSRAFSIGMERVEQAGLLREAGACAEHIAREYTVQRTAEAAEGYYRLLVSGGYSPVTCGAAPRRPPWWRGIHKWGQTW